MLIGPRATFVLTHAVAFGIGTLVWGALRHGHPPDEAAAVLTRGGARASQRSPRTLRSADEILKSPAKGGSQSTDYIEKGLELARSTRLPADPSAALAAALEKWAKDTGDHSGGSPEVFALIYQWVAADPTGFMHFTFADPQTIAIHQRMIQVIFRPAVEHLAEDKGPLALLPALKAPPNNLYAYLPEIFATSLLKKFDLDTVDRARDGLPSEQWMMVSRNIAEKWPMDKTGELVQFAIRENQPDLLFQGSSTRRPGLGAALLATMSDPNVPESFREALKTGGQMGWAVSSDPSVALDTRLSYSYFGTDPEAQSQQLCRRMWSRS